MKRLIVAMIFAILASYSPSDAAEWYVYDVVCYDNVYKYADNHRMVDSLACLLFADIESSYHHPHQWY